MSRIILTNKKWSRLFPILKQQGILFRLRTSCQCADVASCFGKADSIYKTFNRWSKHGIFTKLFKHLADDPNMEWFFIDGSHICVHNMVCMDTQFTTHEAVGKSVGGHTSKTHVAVDVCGNPIEFIITASNVNDIVVAPNLCNNWI